MKGAGILCLFLVAGFYAIRFIYLNGYNDMPTDFLRREYENIHSEVVERDKNMSMPVGGIQRMHELRRDSAWMWVELKRRESHADVGMPALGFLGVILLVLPKVRTPKRRKKASLSKPEVEVSIPEANPREEYVDEYEFTRKAEGGFKLRDEAVQWLSRDPLLKCDYCGSKLKATFREGRETLEFVTFYKKVPEGAKDLRIVLGARWYTKAASELKCTGCDQVVQR